MATIIERLNEFFHRLGNSPRANSAEDALEEIGRTLDAVEDALSGIPKQTPPPPPSMPDGRMYPPLSDNILRRADGTIMAWTRGHIIEIGADGSVVIRNKRTKAVEFNK
jgi:hypothetical protein